MELLLIRPHPALVNHPELEAKQAIVNIDGKYGLSLIYAKSDRWTHGFYCGENTVEAALLVLNVPTSQFSWETADNDYDIAKGEDGCMLEPKGWLTEDDVEYWIGRVREFGIEGWSEVEESIEA